MKHLIQMRIKLTATIFIVAVVLALSTGCASLPFAKSLLNGDVAEKRHRRQEEIIRNFEAHRDQAVYEAALSRWEQNDSKGCREGLEVLLARNPGHIDAHLLLAEVNLLDKRPEDALKQVDDALHLQPGNARALYTKGLVLDAVGQSTGAMSYYEQAARAEPENEMYALCCKKVKDSDGSGEETSNAVVLTAGQGPLNSDKKVIPSANGQGPFLASPDIKQSAAGNPNPAAPIFETDDKTTKNAGLTDSYARAESAVSAEESLSVGQRALSEGDTDAARIAFNKAVAVQPNNPQLPVIAAGAALRTNHPELAVDLLVPAARRFSKSAAIYRMLGVAHYRLGDFQASQVALQQALSLDKSSALSYFLMGCTLAKLGQVESADAYFQQARTLDPRYAVRR